VRTIPQISDDIIEGRGSLSGQFARDLDQLTDIGHSLWAVLLRHHDGVEVGFSNDILQDFRGGRGIAPLRPARKDFIECCRPGRTRKQSFEGDTKQRGRQHCRTQQFVVFALDGGHRLIDLPGYGYAKVPEAMRAHWRKIIDAYLQQRQSLRAVVLIIDSRHPLKDFDRQMLDYCRGIGLACHMLLTKADKLSRNQASATLAAVHRECKAQGWPASAQLFSSLAKTGLDEARMTLYALLTRPAAVMLAATGAAPD